MPVDVEQQLAALGKFWNETIAHVETSEIASHDTARSNRSVSGIDGLAPPPLQINHMGSTSSPRRKRP